MDELADIRARRQRHHLGEGIYQAQLHGTAEERVELDRLVVLVRNGHIPVAEARTMVAALRRSQDARRNAA